MRAVMLNAYGNAPDSLAQAISMHASRPIPTPDLKRALVRIRVSHAALNPIDAKIALGDYEKLLKVTFPAPLGRDFSGWIDAMPEGLSDTKGFRVGDAVCGFLDHEHLDCGSCAEYTLAPMKCLARVPNGVSMRHAAALPLVGLTTRAALINGFNLTPQCKKRILVLGGTSSTGMLALQLARHYGCSEIACTASATHHDLCRELGATICIDYRTQSWWEALDGADFDFVYDTVGGPESYGLSRRVLHSTGIFYTIVGDTTSGKITAGSMIGALCNIMCRGCCGGVKYRMGMNLPCDGEGVDFWLSLMQEGKIRVVIDPASDGATIGDVAFVAALLERQATGRAKGKLVVSL